jgi:hypothetical protein
MHSPSPTLILHPFPVFVPQTTQLRILAGEVEPTTGDVVKSSRNLRVAFLRQEFVDELVETNTLREELYTAFQDERDLLKAISVRGHSSSLQSNDNAPRIFIHTKCRLMCYIDLYNPSHSYTVYFFDPRTVRKKSAVPLTTP